MNDSGYMAELPPQLAEHLEWLRLQGKARRSRYRIIFALCLALVIVLCAVFLMPLVVAAQGIGTAPPGGLPIGIQMEPGKTYRLNDRHILEEVSPQKPAATRPAEETPAPGGFTSLPSALLAGRGSDLTPEQRLRSAYEFCLTDFKEAGSLSTAPKFTDPSCAEIEKRWESSGAKAHYEAEMADWNKARIAREKALIDQAAKESE